MIRVFKMCMGSNGVIYNITLERATKKLFIRWFRENCFAFRSPAMMVSIFEFSEGPRSDVIKRV